MLLSTMHCDRRILRKSSEQDLHADFGNEDLNLVMKTENGGLSLLQTPFPLIAELLITARSLAAVPTENGAQGSAESVLSSQSTDPTASLTRHKAMIDSKNMAKAFADVARVAVLMPVSVAPSKTR